MEKLERENALLRQRIAELEAAAAAAEAPLPAALTETDVTSPFERVSSLTNAEIFRFGRQLVVPGFGLESGGLGSPAALYLGAGGVGRLGIVDHDTVDTNNLHRQVIHTEARCGVNKAVSAAIAIQAIYPDADVVPYAYTLDRTNALQLIQQYDIVLDCTDNIATRYLLSDACVLAGKPIVSGSALRNDGQLTIYNYNNGPCFRCLHPVPPPASTVGRCVDSGVLGVALKEPSFLIFSAMSNPMFRTMRLRHKKKDCAICGDTPTMTELIDYVQFCDGSADDKTVDETILKREERVDVHEYNKVVEEGVDHVLIDVRPAIQYGICRLPNSIHIPIDELDKKMTLVKDMMVEKNVDSEHGKKKKIGRLFLICNLLMEGG
ncbi:uncharacterized protein EV154DRAFT_419373 [Mucor mucedo]|uniref:uncharacterized protein n=1 Tax=Mucor mucedo TaxID=29922 RepID=UPI002220FB17|nr:uncharacterized protein EV154DRAFT_419373 [Mucor mucedo]KAI7892066.1 hypothetical protein EV154DRAFT_419373 [Mucor mucedo]